MQGHTAPPRPPAVLAPFVALLLVLLGATHAAGQLADIEGRLRFVGRVVDANGAPLADATVRVVPSGLTLHDAGFDQRRYESSGSVAYTRYALDALRVVDMPANRTATDGRFSLDVPHVPLPVDPGVVSDGVPWPVLAVTSPGKATWVQAWTPIDHHWLAEVVDVGDLVLHPEVAVTGRLIDEQGVPVRGVELLLWSRRIAEGYAPNAVRLRRLLYMPELMSTTSDAEGRFRMVGLWPGAMEIFVEPFDRVRRVLEPTVEAPGPHDVGDVVLALGSSVSGLVVDPAGRPVRDAEVYVTDRRIRDAWVFHRQVVYGDEHDTIHDQLRQVRLGRRRVVRTDEAGRFRIGGIAEANLTVYVSAPGREPSRTEGVPPGGTPLRIALRPEGRLVVHVVEATTGRPIPGATLQATRLLGNARYDRGDVSLAVLPAADGWNAVPDAPTFAPDDRTATFLVRGAGFVAQRLDVTADGYASIASDAPGVAPGQTRTVTVTLHPESTMGGQVVDRDGAPVQGAHVYLTEPETRRSELAAVETDADGRYVFRGLGALRADVYAWSEGSAETASLSVDLAAAETRDDVHFVLSPAARIRGRVLDPMGAPVADALVLLDTEPFGETKVMRRSNRWEGLLRTDANGRYVFSGLAADTYRVQSTMVDTVHVELSAGEDRALDLHTQRAPLLRGRVTSGTGPVEGVRIRTTQKARPDGRRRWRSYETVESGADGSFALELGGPGTYEVQARMDGGGRSDVQVIVVAAQQEEALVELRLGDGLIAGRVVRDDDGQPVEGLAMSLSSGPDERGQDVSVCSTRTNDAGRYVFRHLFPADYQIDVSGRTVTAEGRHVPRYLPLGEAHVVLGNGEARDDLHFEVCPGAHISGSVTLPIGLPPKDGMTVQLMRMTTDAQPPLYEHTPVKDGAFTFGPLPAGEYRVLAGDGSYGVADLGEIVHLAEHATAELDLVVRD